MHQIQTNSLGNLSIAARTGMFELRFDTFVTRLGWDVKAENGQEIDEFDADPNARYILATSSSGSVDACWRLLPTLGPNMLRDVFPALMHGQPAPAAHDVWELSRFALSNKRLDVSEDAGNHQIGFGELSVAMMAESVRFARANGIARYVTVTTTAIERMLVKQGLHMYRAGPPMRIGRVMTVACFVEIDDTTAVALGV